jgi:hypothetical protein
MHGIQGGGRGTPRNYREGLVSQVGKFIMRYEANAVFPVR